MPQNNEMKLAARDLVKVTRAELGDFSNEKEL